MATVVLPLDQAGDVFGSVEPGVYRLRVTKAGLGETQKGDPKFQLSVVVVQPKESKGTPATINFTYNAIGLALLRQALSAMLGKDLPKKATKINPKALVGKEFMARAYEKDGYTNWTDFKPVKGKEEPDDEWVGSLDVDADDDDDLEFDDD